MQCRICGEKINIVGSDGYYYIEHKCDGDYFFAYIGNHFKTKEEAIKSVPDGIFLEDRVCG